MDDRKKVALECAAIEQKGGDVLAYLKGLGCVSPRGTWYRLQREELGRMEHQITEGRGRRQNMQRVEVARQLIEAIADGVDPMEKLREMGYRYPSQTYQDIKNTCRKKAPELADRLPERTRAQRQHKGGQGMKKEQAKTADKACEPAEKTAEEDFSAAEVFPEGSAEETQGGLRIPAGQMIQIDGMMIRAVEASFGIYEYRNGYLEFKGRNGDAMRLTAARWKEFLSELNRAAALMGVEI